MIYLIIIIIKLLSNSYVLSNNTKFLFLSPLSLPNNIEFPVAFSEWVQFCFLDLCVMGSPITYVIHCSKSCKSREAHAPAILLDNRGRYLLPRQSPAGTSAVWTWHVVSLLFESLAKLPAMKPVLIIYGNS